MIFCDLLWFFKTTLRVSWTVLESSWSDIDRFIGWGYVVHPRRWGSDMDFFLCEYKQHIEMNFSTAISRLVNKLHFKTVKSCVVRLRTGSRPSPFLAPTTTFLTAAHGSFLSGLQLWCPFRCQGMTTSLFSGCLPHSGSCGQLLADRFLQSL